MYESKSLRTVPQTSTSQIKKTLKEADENVVKSGLNDPELVFVKLRVRVKVKVKVKSQKSKLDPEVGFVMG